MTAPAHSRRPGQVSTPGEEKAALELARALQDPAILAAAIAVLLANGAGNLAAEIQAWQEWAAFPQAGTTYRWAITGLLERALPLWRHAQAIVDALKGVGQRDRAVQFAGALIWAIYPEEPAKP